VVVVVVVGRVVVVVAFVNVKLIGHRTAQGPFFAQSSRHQKAY